MKTSARGINLIKACEGLRLEPYLCPAGVPTIGYGSTHGVSMDMGPITQEKADLLLAQDIREESEKYLNLYIVSETSQYQYDALSSLCFNIGAGNFRASTLLRLHNKGDYEGAVNEFWKWRRGGGKILPGLVKRREMEEDLYRLSFPVDVPEISTDVNYANYYSSSNYWQPYRHKYIPPRPINILCQLQNYKYYR